MSAVRPGLGVVILAAGASSRMGTSKLLLPWEGTTVIGHLLWQWEKLGAAQIGVVLRAQDLALAAELDRLHFPGASRLANPRPEHGMFSSVTCAASWTAWREEISHWAIVLGDQPHLPAEMLQALLVFAAQNPAAICQPSFGGRTGHPVILPRAAFAALKRTGVATLKEFLAQTTCPRLAFPLADPEFLADLDTPEDYQRLTRSQLRE